METPKERLTQLINQLMSSVPGMMQTLLKGQLTLWLSNSTDEDILELCDKLTSHLVYVRDGVMPGGGTQGNNYPTDQTDTNPL